MMPEWMQWSKVVCFVPFTTHQSISVDIRFDSAPTKDSTIGVFPAYQDEANWTAWCWYGADGKAGWRQESHSGNLTRPSYARSASTSAFDGIEAPMLDTWYSLLVTKAEAKLSYLLSEKATGRKVLEATTQLAWEGQFLALGSRKAIVSFDNVVVR